MFQINQLNKNLLSFILILSSGSNFKYCLFTTCFSATCDDSIHEYFLKSS